MGGCCVVFLWRYVCFLSLSSFFLSLMPRPFVQSFFVLRYARAPTATRSYLTTVCVLFRFCFLLFYVSLEMSLFPSNFVPLPLSLCTESASYVFPFQVVFFYLVTTGWISDISLCEDSINESIDPATYTLLVDG